VDPPGEAEPPAPETDPFDRDTGGFSDVQFDLELDNCYVLETGKHGNCNPVRPYCLENHGLAQLKKDLAAILKTIMGYDLEQLEDVTLNDWLDMFAAVRDEQLQLKPDDEIFALRVLVNLASTPPECLELNVDEKKQTLSGSPVSEAWLAAITTMGSAFQMTRKKLLVDEDERRKAARAVEADQSDRERRANAVTVVQNFFKYVIRVHRMVARRAELLVTDDVKQATDLVLAKYLPKATDFTKAMAAVELAGKVSGKTFLEFAMPYTADEMKKWSWHPKSYGLPTAPKISPFMASLLRKLWEDYKAEAQEKHRRYLQLSEFKEGAPLAIPDLPSYAKFLHFLRMGRQIYLEFRYMYPDAQLETVHDGVYFHLKLTTTFKALREKRHLALKTYKVRADRQRQRQKAKELQEAAEQKESEASALEKQLNESTRLRSTKTRRDIEAKLAQTQQEAKDAQEAREKALQDLDKADAAAPPINTRKRKRKPAIVRDPNAPPPAPKRGKKGLVYDAPADAWKASSIHKITLFKSLFMFLEEAEILGNGLNRSAPLAIQDAPKQIVSKAYWESVRKALASAVKKGNGFLKSGRAFEAILPVLTEDDIANEQLVNHHFRKIVVAVGLVPEGSVSEASATKVIRSLQTWLPNSDIRFCSKTFNTIGFAMQSNQIDKLKEVVRLNFIASNKVEMVKMLDDITKMYD
jgi:hypothetical protein